MSVAKAYAKALYEAGQESKGAAQSADQVQGELDSLIKTLDSSSELRVAFVAPILAAKDKLGVVAAISKKAGISKMTANFLELLAKKGRLGLLPEIRDAFEVVRLESEGGILGRVVSADALDAADLEGLSKSFTQKMGKKVAFRASTDPSLLAGIKVTVNGTTYDGTLRSQLLRLRDRLVYGAGSTH